MLNPDVGASPLTGALAHPEWRLGVALAAGLLVGVERERRKGDRPGVAGVRSFALVSLLGGVMGLLADSVGVWVGAGFVGLLVVASYLRTPTDDPGVTTEVALFLTYMLGVLAMERPLHALGLSVVGALILALRSHLHRTVRELLSEQELLDGLTLAVCALVVLPLLPDRPVDPWGMVNLFVLWRLVVLVITITSLGYVAQRALGPRYGLTIAGFASGFISSSATVGAMGQRATNVPASERAAVAGAAASTVATFIQLAILVGAAHPPLLARLAVPLGLGGLAALAYALREARAASSVWEGNDAHEPGRAFSLRSALVFAVLVTVVSFAAAFLRERVGDAGVLAAAGVAGLADAHAIAASLATLAAGDGLADAVATAGVLLALSTNTLTKALVARSAGPRSYARRVFVGLVIALAAAWIGEGIVRAWG